MKDLAKMCLTAIISLLAVIVCCCVCSSCQASRNMEIQKQIDYSGDFNQIQSVIESMRADVSRQTKITNNLKLENKTVYLSAPDSTGKQYPVKESTTIASKQEQESIEVDEMLSITLQRLSNRLDTLSNKVDAVLNQKQTVVELSWWNLHKEKIYIAIIILLAGAWIVYQFKKRLNPLTIR